MLTSKPLNMVLKPRGWPSEDKIWESLLPPRVRRQYCPAKLAWSNAWPAILTAWRRKLRSWLLIETWTFTNFHMISIIQKMWSSSLLETISRIMPSCNIFRIKKILILHFIGWNWAFRLINRPNLMDLLGWLILKWDFWIPLVSNSSLFLYPQIPFIEVISNLVAGINKQ